MKKMLVNWEPSGPAQALTSLTKSSSLSLQLEKSQAHVGAENISKSDKLLLFVSEVKACAGPDGSQFTTIFFMSKLEN